MDINQLKIIQDSFVKELELSESGKKTSLTYIVHTLSPSPLVKEGETFQVLVFGGSVTLNALLKKRNNKLVLLKRESRGQKRFPTKEEFLSLVEQELDPSVSLVAVNLAYPLTPVFERGKLDGILVAGSKENTFDGLVGQKVGKEIEKRIKQKTGKTITVSVANDTICLLLSGLTETTSHDIAAGIVGTGMNLAFFLDRERAVNLEAANFDKYPQTPEGKIIDQESAKPGMALFEKETSGAYLYKHFNIIAKRDGIDHPPIASTLELDRILENKDSDAYPVAKMLLVRSASFVATAIGAITAFKKKDLVFVMEGSVFWNAAGYRRHVKQLLLNLVPEYSIKFMKIEDSPIFGAAKLVS